MLICVKPSTSEPLGPTKVCEESEVFGVPSLPTDDNDISVVPDTFSFLFSKEKTIEEYKNQMNDGDSLTVVEYNPFMFFIYDDFWVDGANPDYNVPTIHNEQVWTKVNGEILLTSTFSYFDSYFDQPWFELFDDNVVIDFDHELGYYIPWFEEYEGDDNE